jgi:hypothetical protein
LGTSSHGGGEAIARNVPGGPILVGDKFFATRPGIGRDSIVFHELGHSIPAFASEHSKETLRHLEPFKVGTAPTSIHTRYSHLGSASGHPEEIVSDVYGSLMAMDQEQRRQGIPSQRTTEDEPGGKYVSLEDHVLGLAHKAGLPTPAWHRPAP